MYRIFPVIAAAFVLLGFLRDNTNLSSSFRARNNIARFRGGAAVADKIKFEASQESKEAGLDKILKNNELKFIFVGGKGGVGKTTVSSSLAIQRAKESVAKGNGDVLLLSTDPAHSLSDAFRLNFTGEPQKVPGIPGLWVMEIDPSLTVQKEIAAWGDIAKKAGLDDITGGEFHKIQSWLTSLPGIDEATALASALERIKSNQFATVVFDTAPTGHTIKLLALPEILQKGIDKLDTLASRIMGYLATFKSFFTPANPNENEKVANPQQILSEKLKKYKESVMYLGDMLKDKTKTNFVIVCIAEYLSVMETKRLVKDLQIHQIANSHIVVNQLVKGSMSNEEAESLVSLLDGNELVNKFKKCNRLMAARQSIQQSYLENLTTAEETEGITVVPLPLMPAEVTGAQRLEKFSGMLRSTFDIDGSDPPELC